VKSECDIPEGATVEVRDLLEMKYSQEPSLQRTKEEYFDRGRV